MLHTGDRDRDLDDDGGREGEESSAAKMSNGGRKGVEQSQLEMSKSVTSIIAIIIFILAPSQPQHLIVMFS